MAALHSFIKSHLRYCPLVWANQSKGGKRWVWDLFTITTLFHRHTPSVSTAWQRSAVIEVYKALKGLSPKCMQCMLTLNKTNRNLRSDNKILPKCHTANFGLKSFAYQAGSLCNKLPNIFRICESLKDFETKIVIWSIDNDMWYIHFTLHFSIFSICWFNLFYVLYVLLSLLVFKSNFSIIVVFMLFLNLFYCYCWDNSTQWANVFCL